MKEIVKHKREDAKGAVIIAYPVYYGRVSSTLKTTWKYSVRASRMLWNKAVQNGVTLLDGKGWYWKRHTQM